MQQNLTFRLGLLRKIAVNRCLNQVNIKHREGLHGYAEISLNDERKKRGASANS
jgi:hypothetical protein